MTIDAYTHMGRLQKLLQADDCNLLSNVLHGFDQFFSLNTLFKLETSGEFVQLLERHTLHRLDKLIAQIVGNPGVQNPPEKVLLNISRDSCLHYVERLTRSDHQGG
jgi:hypothetical protein